MAPTKDIEAALAAWRAAERRVADADGNLTPGLIQELADARATYQEIATAHMTERIDALHDAERRRSAAEPYSDPFHEAAADEKVIADQIWSEGAQIDRATRRHSGR